MNEGLALPKRADADALADVIAVCAARIDSALHQLLTHIRHFDEIRGWSWQNTKSCAHWLSWKIGLGMVAAREKVRVAQALGRLPLIDAALSRGELSYAKVRAMTRVATKDNEDLLLAQAQGSTGAELERICAGFRKLQPGAVADEERRTVRRRALDDGLVQIELRLLPDEAERVWRAIGEMRRELSEGATAESPKGARPTMADAAVAMAEASLAARPAETGTAAAERRLLFVHLSERRLGAHDGAGRGPGSWTAELHDGTGIAGATLLRLACDAGLVVAKTDDSGNVLDLGRKSRTVSAPLLRALKMRDRGCRFPGCNSAAFVDAHHIEHWAQGGETKIDNLVLVCSQHHVALHEGGFRVERGELGGLIFRDLDGREIEPAPCSSFRGNATASLEAEQASFGIEIEPGTAQVRRSFLRPDWDGCVRALVGRAERTSAESTQLPPLPLPPSPGAAPPPADQRTHRSRLS